MRFSLSIMLAVCISIMSTAADPPAKTSKPGDQQSDAEQGDPQEMSVYMKKKLDYSQAILRGLATGDFETIKTNGVQMRLLNRVEGFVRRRNPRYRMHVRAFENICEDIVAQADEENLAGVTLAFNQLTVNCVNCHRSLREGQTDQPKSVDKDSESPQ